ncbi:hypothetical protein J6X96_04845 [bacterium]|nr:hypothetical protein [bacterium]
MPKRLKILIVLLTLLIGGCMLPRMFVAAFIPFQRLMIWSAAMGARYGAPLVMLLVDASPEAEPYKVQGEFPEPYLADEPATPEFLAQREDLVKVYIFRGENLSEERYRKILLDAAMNGQTLCAVPLAAEDIPRVKETLAQNGVELEEGEL